jgi:hypothetical protein
MKLIGSLSLKTSAYKPPFIGRESLLLSSFSLKTKKHDNSEPYKFLNTIRAVSLLFSRDVKSGKITRVT